MALHVRRAAAVAVAVALAAAAPATASPLLRNQLKPCYVAATPTQREPVAIDAADFRPGAVIDAFVDEVQLPEFPQADANGDVRGQIQAPWIPSGERPFTLRLTERDNPLNSLTATSKVTLLSVTTSPKRVRPANRRVRFRGSGFTEAGRPVFAHYLFHGVLRKTVRLGRPEGDCGDFSVRARQIPLRRPRAGTWTVLVDQRRRYSPEAAPTQVRLSITVRRVPRS